MYDLTICGLGGVAEIHDLIICGVGGRKPCWGEMREGGATHTREGDRGVGRKGRREGGTKLSFAFLYQRIHCIPTR